MNDSKQQHQPEQLFRQTDNLAGANVWAAFVYSLIPYLGILFVPVTLAFGLYELFKLRRNPGNPVKRTVILMVLSGVVLALQILLWWLLYYVPTLGREF